MNAVRRSLKRRQLSLLENDLLVNIIDNALQNNECGPMSYRRIIDMVFAAVESQVLINLLLSKHAKKKVVNFNAVNQ
jgi:hypothetical protein